jgi:hypothetical protein
MAALTKGMHYTLSITPVTDGGQSTGTLLEIEDVSADIEANVTDLISIHEGLQGFTWGAKIINVNFTNYVTTSGPEFDVTTAIKEEQVFNAALSVGEGSKVLNMTGVFTTGGFSQGINANSQATFTFRGKFSKIG